MSGVFVLSWQVSFISNAQLEITGGALALLCLLADLRQRLFSAILTVVSGVFVLSWHVSRFILNAQLV